ncbi:MAG: 16S rRNA (uracil(1498)-N(3))-methyltransferase [Clostridia bacterium]|nr:16S rRNA (uracil(1498)-N(3))-methyltransferase [Clostridia bacterium]
MDNRYYFEECNNDYVIIKDGEANHLSKVRRAKIGDEIMAFNGDGYDYRLRIDDITKDKVRASVIDKSQNKAFLDLDITVYLAMIKNDALKTAIDSLAQLNVKNVKLFKSDYTEAVFDDKKLDKLRAVAIQTSKQCERADIMNISIIDKKNIKADCSKYDNVFFAYEDSNTRADSFIGDFAVIIGPEGGFSPNENEYFSSFAKNITLGKTILRAEVAGATAVATLRAISHES